jgi:non-ribosomal peptide synthetase component F
MLAVLKAGRFFVTLEPKLPKSRLQLTAADCHPSLIISKGEHRELAEELVGERQRVLTFDTVFGPDAVVQRERRISPDDYACIMFTSGSTGRPKGILWSQRSLLHHVMLRTNADGLCCADRIAHLSSGTSNATTNVFLALLNGATLLAYDTERGTMNELWDWLAREQVTVCMIAAPLFRSLCAAPEKRGSLDRLRIIRLRSDTALVGDVVLFKANFSSPCVLANGLASSETGMLSEYYIGHDSVLEDDNVPVGFAAPDKELLVVDDGGRPLDRGAVGELVVRSRFLSPG